MSRIGGRIVFNQKVHLWEATTHIGLNCPYDKNYQEDKNLYLRDISIILEELNNLDNPADGLKED